MSSIKRAAVIGDFSGAGCGILNSALPVLAAAGVEVCGAPTFVRSVLLPDVPETAQMDLTALLPETEHRWKELGLRFDAVFCSFAGGEAEAAAAFAGSFCTGGCFLMVDPADHCEPSVTGSGVENLLRRADLIAADVGEAAALLGEKKREGPYDRRYTERLLRDLCSLGPKMAVVRDIWFNSELPGAAGFNCDLGNVSYAFSPHVPGKYFGCGSVFSPALLAGFLNGMNLTNALQLAVDFTADCMQKSRESGGEARFGLRPERSLPRLVRELGLEVR